MVNEKGKHNTSLKIAAQGPELMAQPSYIHTYQSTRRHGPEDSNLHSLLKLEKLFS
jgi:hypothetical protein